MALEGLRALSKAMPQLDAQAAKREEEARRTGLQAALARPEFDPSQAQKLAAASVAEAGQLGVQQGARSLQQQQEMFDIQQQQRATDAALKQQQARRVQEQSLASKNLQQQVGSQAADIAARKQMTGAEIEQAQRLQAMGFEFDNRLNALTLRQREDLNTIGLDLKAKLFDNQMTFERDDMGRKFSNERQMQDYAVASAKSEEDLRDKIQILGQSTQRSIELMERAAHVLETKLKQDSQKKKSKLDFESKKRIAEYAKVLKEKIRRKQAEAQNRAGMIKGLFTVAGGIVGAVYGGPAGAVLGASVMGSAGEVVAGGTA